MFWASYPWLPQKLALWCWWPAKKKKKRLGQQANRQCLPSPPAQLMRPSLWHLPALQQDRPNCRHENQLRTSPSP